MHNPLRASSYAYQTYSKLWGILDWLYPPHCGGCGKVGSRWCQICQSQVIQVKSQICPRCGRLGHHSGLCSRCQTHPPSFKAMRSWAIFDGPLRQALHRLKYGRDMALGEILSRPLAQLFSQLDWEIDCILPVPLDPTRKKQRGYNQAALLAFPMALATGTAYEGKGLHKIKETQSQVGLSLEQRRHNVAGAFLADPNRIRHRNVLIIDDVATSGATIESCASAIMLAGADQVFAMTLAQTADPATPVMAL